MESASESRRTAFVVRVIAKAWSKLGVLTDGTTYDQYIVLARLGVLNLVDEVVTSEEVGVTKPSMTMFATILSRLDVAAHKTLMVGNNWGRDIEGAREAGMLTAYLSHGNAVGEADLLIRSVLDLEDVLSDDRT